MFTPLNLSTSVLFGPRRHAVERRRGRPELAEQLAQRDPGQPLAGPLQALGSDVDAVVELEIDHRDDGRVGHALGKRALGVLNGVPALGIGPATNRPIWTK